MGGNRIVAPMILLGGAMLVSSGAFDSARAWIQSRAFENAKPSRGRWSDLSNQRRAQWAGGYAGLWIILSLLSESGPVGDLAVALAWAAALSAAGLALPAIRDDLQQASGRTSPRDGEGPLESRSNIIGAA